eukprot:748372-Hanusia_phi.AAC.1
MKRKSASSALETLSRREVSIGGSHLFFFSCRYNITFVQYLKNFDLKDLFILKYGGAEVGREGEEEEIERKRRKEREKILIMSDDGDDGVEAEQKFAET